MATAASQPGVSVVSMSWGLAEGQAITAQDEAMYDSYLTTPAGHQGVTFVASTGDYGTADPEYPSFSPNVVAVGGTSLSVNADGSYNSETGWGSSTEAAGNGQFIGSGGGLSLYEAEPAWQLNVQNTGYRSTPDVSMVADPDTGAWIADPYNLPGDNPWAVVGGTSLSAPSWAGLIVLADQGRAAAGEATLGTASPTEAQQALYSVPQSDFNAITTGTNGLYNAGAGYNLVTGLGSPVANLLIPDLVSYTNGQADVSGRTVTVTGNGGVNSSTNNPAVTTNVINSMINVFDAEFVPLAGIANGVNAGRVNEAASAPATSPTLPLVAAASPVERTVAPLAARPATASIPLALESTRSVADAAIALAAAALGNGPMSRSIVTTVAAEMQPTSAVRCGAVRIPPRLTESIWTVATSSCCPPTTTCGWTAATATS